VGNKKRRKGRTKKTVPRSQLSRQCFSLEDAVELRAGRGPGKPCPGGEIVTPKVKHSTVSAKNWKVDVGAHSHKQKKEKKKTTKVAVTPSPSWAMGLGRGCDNHEAGPRNCGVNQNQTSTLKGVTAGGVGLHEKGAKEHETTGNLNCQ